MLRQQKTYLLITALVVLLLAACNPQIRAATNTPEPTVLTIFAAASLTESFTALAAEFEANHPPVDIVFNFAGSQTLRLQIEQGARADIFASANESHLEDLVEANVMGQPVIVAQNNLVVITPAHEPVVATLADLARPDIKLILAAPNVPAGQYARESLAKLNRHPTLPADFSSRVLNNLVSEEDNVKGVVAKIRLGEADAGIVYTSDVTPAVGGEVTTIPIPVAYNVEAVYPLAISTGSQSPELAQQFVDFVLSSRGQTIFTDFGFQSLQFQARTGTP